MIPITLLKMPLIPNPSKNTVNPLWSMKFDVIIAIKPTMIKIYCSLYFDFMSISLKIIEAKEKSL